jgi:hypothetical protein
MASYRSRARRSSSCHRQARREERASEKTRTQKKQEKESQTPRNRLTWKTRHAGPLWIRSALVAKLLPEPLLRLSLDEVGRRGVDVLSLLLQARCGSSER